MKTVLITGGSRGIGSACVRAFYGAGYQVAFCYLHAKDEALALSKELIGTLAFQADVSSPDDVSRLVDETLSALGHIDVLVNNAGIAWAGLMTDMTDSEWDHLFDVNVKGTFLCCRAVMPQMIRSQGGSIVNLSSIWGITGASCEVAYSASKAAVLGLTRALAKEVGPCGIRVNCVAPGVIDTDMNIALDAHTLDTLREETPLGVLGTPADVASAVLYLASPQAGFVTGQVLSPNGGLVI
ncbi:MAG: 3-oxoacyl-ACP reductase FabG [Oscillospiraceae bacterium]